MALRAKLYYLTSYKCLFFPNRRSRIPMGYFRESRSGKGQPIPDRKQADESKMAFQTRPRSGLLPIGYFHSRSIYPIWTPKKTFPNETTVGTAPDRESRSGTFFPFMTKSRSDIPDRDPENPF